MYTVPTLNKFLLTYLHLHGLGVYVRNNHPISCRTGFESLDLSFMCFRLALLHSTTFLFFRYRSPSSQDCSLIDVVSDSIDQALSLFPTANIAVFGDFLAHHAECLNSNSTDAAGSLIHNFYFNHSPSLLDSCLVSDPDIRSALPLCSFRR